MIKFAITLKLQVWTTVLHSNFFQIPQTSLKNSVADRRKFYTYGN